MHRNELFLVQAAAWPLRLTSALHSPKTGRLMRTPAQLLFAALFLLPSAAQAVHSDTAALNRELQTLRDAFSRAYVEALRVASSGFARTQLPRDVPGSINRRP